MPTLIATASLQVQTALTGQARGGKTLATAALVVNTTITPRTAFVYQQQGILDVSSGTVKAQGDTRWNAYTTWSSFTDFRGQPLPIIWTAPVIDVGDVKYFTLTTEADFDGTCSYEVYTSETGLFRGEETELDISDGDFDIPAFYGRYVYVTAYVSGAELRTLNITTSSESRAVTLRDIDTATLGGSSSARIVALPRPVSRVLSIDIQPQAPAPYAVDLYVSSTATSTVLTAMVINKADAEPYFTVDYLLDDYLIAGESPSFCLFGIDNQPRDGVVDIQLDVLPRQLMTSGNIITV